MDEVVWVEVLSRQHEVTLRQRIANSDAITIGRAYDNDIVLDDAHVAAHHLRFTHGADGRWTAEDLGSINGLFLEGDQKRRDQIVLDGSTTLQVGNTFLRLRTATHDVPSEVPLVRSLPRWPIALACIALVFVLALLDLWRAETAEPKLIRYLTPLLVLSAVIAVWTFVWSVLSRILSGHAHFGKHLLIIGVGLLLYSAYDEFSELGSFALSWAALERYVYVGAWLAFGAVCFAHLRALGPSHRPVKAVAALALAALGITVQSLKLSEWHANYGQASTLQRLEPPSIRIASAQSQAAFFTNITDLKITLDKARSEEPSGDAAADGSDD
ncbi:MAG: FHA domain-containing protein [Dokdonella sp.]